MFALNCTTLFVQIQENKSRKGVTSWHLRRSSSAQYSFEFLFALGEVWKLLLDSMTPDLHALVVQFEYKDQDKSPYLWSLTFKVCLLFLELYCGFELTSARFSKRTGHMHKSGTQFALKILIFTYRHVILHVQAIQRCSKGTLKH